MGAVAAISALTAVVSVAGQVKGAQDSKKKAKIANREAGERRSLLKAQSAELEIDRKRRLRSALSTQRSLFGARGVSTRSGTAIALATNAINASKATANLNRQKNSLQLNQINRGGGFNQTRSLLGAGSSILGSGKTIASLLK